MNVAQVSRMKSFGMFRDFKWDANLPEFKRFNLIYGWNRSGKTTLSRVLSACEKNSTNFDQYPDGGTFDVLTDGRSHIRSGDLGSCHLPVRVFNQDFIDENVSFKSSACTPIVYVSKEDIEARKTLDDLAKATEALVAVRDAARGQRAAADKAVIEFRQATALNVKNTVGNLKVADQYRNYDKAKLKTLLEAGADFVELSDDDFEAFKSVIGSDPKTRQTPLPAFEIHLVVGTEVVSGLRDLSGDVNALVERNVVSETLDRLKDDAELNEWVKRGYDLQRARVNRESCLFCGKPLDEGFLDSLSRHFSDDYTSLVADIQSCLQALQAAKREKVAAGRDLYRECAKTFEDDLGRLNALIDELNAWLDKCCQALQLKLDNPLAAVDPPVAPPADFEASYSAILTRLNSAIEAHNSKVDNHDGEVKTKKDQLAKHIVAVAMRDQGYAAMLEGLADAEAADAKADEELKANTDTIAALTTRTSNVGKAVERINEHLEELFGRKEVRLELGPDGKDYVIRRDGSVAKNLSEGEKTAVAFAYFLAKVRERDFRVSDGVVVIDDPISSLDSNFIFHIFSLIQRHFKDAGQLFVMTHSFELLNLTKTWFSGRNSKCRRKGEIDCCGFYCVENTVVEDLRCAYVAEMDDTLRRFNSEYQYLFVRLRQFTEADPPAYADLYTVGNIARRFLEVYTSFKIPTTGDLRGKVEQLQTETVTSAQKDKVYRLVQEFSHSQDPTSGVVHKDKGEAQEAARLLLKIVEESDPTHYRLLSKSVPTAA